MLAELGHQVIEAGTGKEALVELESNSIDVLITDIGLPDTVGGDLAVRAVAEKPDLTVVFATGESHKPGNAPPGSRLLQKPYNEMDLAAVLAGVNAGS
ncbi:response regulator [Neorhizobium sp. IRS_2294]